MNDLANCVDLARKAEELGIRLRHHNGGPPAWYSESQRTISTRRGLSIAMYKSCLAHELGHAIFAHSQRGHPHFDIRQEARANEWAATFLIDDEEFRQAMIWHDHRLPAVADELEVTQHILSHYLHFKRRKAS